MIKKALQQFEYCHYKTLIYPNKEFSNVSKEQNEDEKEEIKSKILSILSSKGSTGISLS